MAGQEVERALHDLTEMLGCLGRPWLHQSSAPTSYVRTAREKLGTSHIHTILATSSLAINATNSYICSMPFQI